MGNSPTNFTDPDGRNAIVLGGGAILFVVGGGLGVALYNLSQHYRRSGQGSDLSHGRFTFPIDPPGKDEFIPAPNRNYDFGPMSIPPFPGVGYGQDDNICSVPEPRPDLPLFPPYFSINSGGSIWDDVPDEDWEEFLGDSIPDDVIVNSGSWLPGSLNTPEESILRHFADHGSRVGANTPQEYVDQAERFKQRVLNEGLEGSL